jgi:aminopeptidase
MPPRTPASPELATALARSVLRKNLKVQPGEKVTIEAWPHTLPWAIALARETRRMKAMPVVTYEDEDAFWDTVDSSEAKVLGANPGHEWASLGATDVYIHMWGPGDRVRLNALPAKRQEELFQFNPKWYAAASKAGLRGARLEVGRPFPTLATAYGVNESEWRDEVVRATMVDPALLARTAAPIVRALERGKEVHVTHENGTDLTLSLAGKPARQFLGTVTPADQKRPFGMLTTIPSGSIRIALSDKSADGTLVGNRTCYYDDGKATSPTLEFSNGRLTSAKFRSGGERFDAAFKSATPGKDRPGILSIGLNPRLHDTPQLEDVEAGAVMVSVGGNQFLGGRNKSSFFGWGITAGATVEVDGKPLWLPTAA